MLTLISVNKINNIDRTGTYIYTYINTLYLNTITSPFYLIIIDLYLKHHGFSYHLLLK